MSHPERGQLLDCPILLSQYTKWDSGVFLWDTKLLKGARDQVCALPGIKQVVSASQCDLWCLPGFSDRFYIP